jgi:predicted PurR-regulated permease PerM
VAGAFIAVPLLAAFKILCDHIETLAPVGEFLGD